MGYSQTFSIDLNELWAYENTYIYLQKAFDYSYSHSYFFCTSSRVSSLLLYSMLFFLFFPLFTPCLFSSLYFPRCTQPPSPCTIHHIHCFFHPAAGPSQREGGTGKGGPVHSPSAWQPQIQATRLVQKIRKQLN